MKCQLSEETDEENCDDPIKLFDSDINAVYFGSHKQSTRDTVSRWKFENIVNDEFCQISENFVLGRPNELIQIVQSGITSECDITPLCVKLVDCRKFPWYFRKYTQQILNKTNLYQKSDSDHEVDVVGIEEDSNDCFIIEDLQDVTNKIINNQIKENTMKSNQTHPELNKINKDLRRRREEEELKKALRLKNVVKVDFKRNQGLVGMTIIQKVTNATLDVKTDRTNEVKEAKANKKDVMVDENHTSATDKILSHIATQSIKIPEEKESNSIGQFKISNEGQDLVVGKSTSIKSTSSQNVPVQFNISKISEKLIDNLILKKMNDLSSEAKPNSKESNKSLSKFPENKLNIVNEISEKLIDNLILKKMNDLSSEAKPNSKESNKSLSKFPENKLNIVNEKKLSSKVALPVKSTNSSNKLTSHVKDVKKTNKYKNDQIKLKNKNKACHSSLIGLLVTKQSTEDLKNPKQKKHKDGTQSKLTELVKKPRKKIEKQKREPKSPILHCSAIPKKLKPKHEVSLKCNKPNTNSNVSKESDNLNKIVNKLKNLNNYDLMQDYNRPKNVIPKNAPDSKASNAYTKQASQKEWCTMQDKTVSQISDIHTKSLNVPDKHAKKGNDVSKINSKVNNTETISLSHNKTLNEQNLLHNMHQDNVNKHSLNTASVRNPSPNVPIKNSKPAVCNPNVPTTTSVAATASVSKSSDLSEQYANFINSLGPQWSQYPVHNAVPGKMSHGNIPNNNNNVPVQNRYASAIILKPNHQMNFPVGKYSERPAQAMALQRPNNMSIPVHTQPRFQDSKQPCPQYYQSAPSGRYQRNFPTLANYVPNQFHPPKDNIHQLCNSMQNFYRGCWLPQNLAPPPPPPLPVSPNPSIPKINEHNVNQTIYRSNLNTPFYSSVSVTQYPQNASCQNSVNNIQTKNSSIIGMNNDGLVKKINIIARPGTKKDDTKKKAFKLQEMKIPQIVTPLGESEVVTTKMEMLEELDKLSFADEDISDSKRIYLDGNTNTRKESTFEVAIMSNKPGRFETLKLTVNPKKNCMGTDQAKGYSPPILPIPTYQKVLDRVVSNSPAQNSISEIVRTDDPRLNKRHETKPMRKRDFVKCCKRKLNNAWNIEEDGRKKDDAKKISLEEYKKRIFKNDCRSEHANKKMCKEKYNNSLKQPHVEYKNRENVDYNIETDLGYDSDSTVVL